MAASTPSDHNQQQQLSSVAADSGDTPTLRSMFSRDRERYHEMSASLYAPAHANEVPNVTDLEGSLSRSVLDVQSVPYSDGVHADMGSVGGLPTSTLPGGPSQFSRGMSYFSTPFSNNLLDGDEALLPSSSMHQRYNMNVGGGSRAARETHYQSTDPGALQQRMEAQTAEEKRHERLSGIIGHRDELTAEDQRDLRDINSAMNTHGYSGVGDVRMGQETQELLGDGAPLLAPHRSGICERSVRILEAEKAAEDAKLA